MKGLLLHLASVSVMALLVACSNSDPVNTLSTSKFEAGPLRTAADRAQIRWGAAVSVNPLLMDAQYRQLAGSEFNTLTPENALKFGIVHPEPGVYDFSGGDLIADFARANGMKMRGHTLIWHQQLPEWINNGQFTRDELIAIMREHIYTVLGHYRERYADVVIEWDVVNEAIAADGSRRDTVWQRVIGDDYIALAFQFAHEAWPELALYYNDFEDNQFMLLDSTFNLDGTPALDRPKGIGASVLLSDCSLIPKCAAMRSLAEELLAQGIALSGIGFQAHIASAASADYAKLTEWVEPLGLKWALTELDTPCPVGPLDAACFAVQANTFSAAARGCLESPACDTIVQWGVNDTYSWWPGFTFDLFEDALAFGRDYQPKPAADALLALFHQHAIPGD